MSQSLMTTQQAASYLNVAVSTLEHWRSEGRGPAYVRLGSNVRYRVTDVDAYVQGQTISQ